jgi:hypothetical protein
MVTHNNTMPLHINTQQICQQQHQLLIFCEVGRFFVFSMILATLATKYCGQICGWICGRSHNFEATPPLNTSHPTPTKPNPKSHCLHHTIAFITAHGYWCIITSTMAQHSTNMTLALLTHCLHREVVLIPSTQL